MLILNSDGVAGNASINLSQLYLRDAMWRDIFILNISAGGYVPPLWNLEFSMIMRLCRLADSPKHDTEQRRDHHVSIMEAAGILSRY
jgi:hypothetical protein